MQKNTNRRLNLFLLTIIVLLVSIIFLTSCQSTDKDESYLNTSEIEHTKFEYDATTNKTQVIWMTTLTNNTIYNFDSFSVRFKLYNDDTLISTETFNYSRGVKHGKDYTGKFYFYADNVITSIEYVSWTANYTSFWQTYKIWFIVMIVIASVASVIYIIIMIVQDLELSDTFDAIVDFFEEYTWVAICFIAPLAGTVWGIVTANWVPILIVISGIVAFIILVLIAHLIKFIVESIAYNIDYGYGISRGNDNRYDVDDEDNSFDPAYKDVSDYVDDRDSLMLFSVEQLKEYCRENEIRGFSSLNKSSLVDLIMSGQEPAIIESSSKSNKKTVAKSNLPKITFDDIAGLEVVKEAFRDKVILPFEHKEIFEKFGKKAGGGILLYGLPGTGKTMFAEACSNEIDAKFFSIKCSDIKSKWYGESEQKVKKIFADARKEKKTIIFFDEFEAIGAKRTDSSENGNNDLVPQILAEMQGVGSSKTNSTIVVIAATNKPWMIDSAFLRPGRFDEKIYVPLPDFAARKKIFEIQLNKLPVADDLDYNYLAKITDGFNGADIKEFCEKLKMSVIKDSLEKGEEQTIGMKHVSCIEGTVKSSVMSEEIVKLKEFEEHFFN